MIHKGLKGLVVLPNGLCLSLMPVSQDGGGPNGKKSQSPIPDDFPPFPSLGGPRQSKKGQH